jgi:hypothetical protein
MRAITANGNLYCPKTPRALTGLGPLARDATAEETAAHDTQTAELARYKLGRITRDDAAVTTASPAPPSWTRPVARCYHSR